MIAFISSSLELFTDSIESLHSLKGRSNRTGPARPHLVDDFFDRRVEQVLGQEALQHSLHGWQDLAEASEVAQIWSTSASQTRFASERHFFQHLGQCFFVRFGL